MKKYVFTLNALAIAFAAVFVTQVGHESTHGIAATLVGAKWTELNLFFTDYKWAGTSNTSSEIIINGSAAIFNIILGFIAAYLFQQKKFASRGTIRLFLFYLAAYNLFAGFGYLFTDPLFYQRGGENLGDWKKIIDMLGGGWNVRLPISLIGAIGVLWGFFWVGYKARVFLPDEQPARLQEAMKLLLVPYLVINILMTILGFFNPLGKEVAVIEAIHYFFGYIGLFWGTFIAGKWNRGESPGKTSLPEELQTGWSVAGGILLVIMIFVLLPSVYFK